jgi:hypothetical protein
MSHIPAAAQSLPSDLLYIMTMKIERRLNKLEASATLPACMNARISGILELTSTNLARRRSDTQKRNARQVDLATLE